MNKIYTILLTLVSFTAFADGMHIRGFIKDMDTQKPVKNAYVMVTFYKGVQFSDVTDSLGQYDIMTTVAVPEGDYDIYIHAIDYYDPTGFIHVTKDCFRDFSIKKKSKTEDKKNLAQAIDTTPAKVFVPSLDGYAPNNLVFLIDISSSMNAPERLPLVKASLKYLVEKLRDNDKVAILTFSDVVREVLPSTSDKALLMKTIDNLGFGSTTQGSAAMSIAYKTALKNYVEKGNNRVVLASDGLFTSGEKDYYKMQQTIEGGLEKNVTLSIFCFGKNTSYVTGKLKTLAKTGKGNFANILDAEEAKQRMLEEAQAVKVGD